MGAPGAGKGTQAELLRNHLGACHLSTGDVFRTAGSKKECEQSQAIREAGSYMKKGQLVPDQTVWAIVRERQECLECAGGFILDGFPRTLSQAESLQTLMEEEGIVLDAVVSYELPFEEIVSRLGAAGPARNAKPFITKRSGRRKLPASATNAAASCFSEKTTVQSRYLSAWTHTTEAPHL